MKKKVIEILILGGSAFLIKRGYEFLMTFFEKQGWVFRSVNLRWNDNSKCDEYTYYLGNFFPGDFNETDSYLN
jgi:hypothetical protein